MKDLQELKEHILGNNSIEKNVVINESLGQSDSNKIIGFDKTKQYYKGYLKDRLISDFVATHNALIILINELKDVKEAKPAIDKAIKAKSNFYN